MSVYYDVWTTTHLRSKSQQHSLVIVLMLTQTAMSSSWSSVSLKR